MSFIQAIILGIVQGLTEFIPISSTAHLILATRLTGLAKTMSAEQTTAIIAVIQLGTLLAVFVYFARDIWAISYAFVRDHLALLSGRLPAAPGGGGLWRRLSHEARLGWLVFLGSLPIGVVGLVFKDFIEGAFTKNLWVISTMLVAVALLLLVAEKVGSRRRGMEELGLLDAVVVGCAQVIALIPGASRSGSTIMGGLFAGQERETAARFSFLLSIPAIAASGLLEMREAARMLPAGSAGPLLVATVVSAVVGWASIYFLLRFLRSHSTGVFIAYRVALGALIVGLLLAGVVRPLDSVEPAHGGAAASHAGPAGSGSR
ncbi:MAG TPA: undecaprenyl-diphosphate phosphatase [Pyrinomonadaceae bacterium]|nr:undecaprenyl-diphosphate phosphatase [Pyrinomonadaceae bacterium]